LRKRSGSSPAWDERRGVDERRAGRPRRIENARTSVIDLYDLPLLPSWHTLLIVE
jgi:hypothetical protein